MMNEKLLPIDHSAFKANQLIIISLIVLAFVFNLPWLAALVGLVMLVGTLLGAPGFGFLYRHLLKPAGLMKPVVIADHPEPHRFAQGLGSIFMLIGALALNSGYPVLGWGLAWLVAALAALNAFAGFCVGCMIYYWLSRMKTPGFYKNPPAGVVPGMRPQSSAGISKESRL